MARDDFVTAMQADPPSKAQIRAVIDYLGMTHRQIAEALGVSVSAVDKWTGGAEPRRIPAACWILLLLLADSHPTHRLVKRRTRVSP